MQLVAAAGEMSGENFSKHISHRHHEALAGFPELPFELPGPVDDVWRAYHRHLHKHQEGLDHEHDPDPA